MEKPLLTLKPSIVNALLPLFAKNILYSGVLALIIYGIYSFLTGLGLIPFLPSFLVWLIVLAILVLLIPIFVRLFILVNTTYNFYKGHISTQFKFITIKTRSALYKQIVNIKVDITIWDRLCQAGDIILYTAEDKDPNVVLRFIKNPAKVESNIFKMIHSREFSSNNQNHKPYHPQQIL